MHNILQAKEYQGIPLIERCSLLNSGIQYVQHFKSYKQCSMLLKQQMSDQPTKKYLHHDNDYGDGLWQSMCRVNNIQVK
jgi:hypothetical protein